ncbi:MAG TPA: hypothetical protein VFS43_24435 [Polyangiaceae bacterium]|nr:hypothetical protein [Polyangiaceae bacterium]
MGLSLDDVAPEGPPVWRRLRELAARGEAAALEALCRDLCERLWAFGAPGRARHEKLRVALRLFERTGSAAALASAGDPAALAPPSRRFFFRRYRRYLRDDFAHRACAERRLREALLAEPGPAAKAFRQLAPPAPDAALLARLLACAGRVPAGVKLAYFRTIWHRRPLRRVALEHLRGLAAAGDAEAAAALAAAESWGARPPARPGAPPPGPPAAPTPPEPGA